MMVVKLFWPKIWKDTGDFYIFKELNVRTFIQNDKNELSSYKLAKMGPKNKNFLPTQENKVCCTSNESLSLLGPELFFIMVISEVLS